MENKKCEGNCIETHGQHKGEVREVIVDGSHFIATKFFYCENAIKEDVSRGFQVHVKGEAIEEEI